MQAEEVLQRLKSLADPAAVAGMAKFGINPTNTLGVSVPKLRGIARDLGKDHELAEQLWASGVHEARLLAGMVAEPRKVTEEQMERWVAQFDSWDVCDQCCSNLFDKSAFAYQKAREWSRREEEFVKRAGFTLMACLAVHDKKGPDERFLEFLPLIEQGADDDRNFVRKAVNWALRQIGKRSLLLNQAAVKTARDVQQIDSKAARWIASDALRELTSEKTLSRLEGRSR